MSAPSPSPDSHDADTVYAALSELLLGLPSELRASASPGTKAATQPAMERAEIFTSAP